MLPFDKSEDRDDNEDEKPTVVVLRLGDLTSEEADNLLQEKEEADGIGLFACFYFSSRDFLNVNNF